MGSLASTLIAVAAIGLLFGLGWRWASRQWALPCPSLLGALLESPWYQRLSGTEKTLARMGLAPGQKILEIGPGPGRLLIPAAQRVLPGGEAVGIELQQRMYDRLQSSAARAGVNNLTAILGDATQPHVPESSFDLAFIVTTLGEIPDRAAVLAQCYRAIKPGGRLSVTEMFGDPHYQWPATVERLARQAAFVPEPRLGHWWFYTANFTKPVIRPAPPGATL